MRYYLDTNILIYVLSESKDDRQYLSLQIDENHKDMNDHLIISQAISDKIPLISSDNKFPFYETQNLKFVFNKR